MSTPCFFLSYASIDEGELDKAVADFCGELIRQLRQKLGVHKDEVSDKDIGFFAPAMKRGTNWPSGLAENLASCRVLICLYSERYFKSPACGKEFKIFANRLQDFADKYPNLPPPPVIVPVLWVVPTNFPKLLPRAVQAIHYKGSDSALKAGGVYHLKTNPRYAAEYQDYLEKLADTVREAAELKPCLPKSEKIPDFEKAWNAWIDPPEAPTGFDFQPNSSGHISLRWITTTKDEDGFQLERSRETEPAYFTEKRQLSAGSTSYTDKVVGGRKYRYRLCAFNGGGRSDYAEIRDVEIAGLPPPVIPQPPGNVSATAISAYEIQLSWEDRSKGVAGVRIERQRQGEEGFGTVIRLGSGISTYTDAGLTPATTYVYRVCATEDNFDSEYVYVTAKTRRRWIILILLLVCIALITIAVMASTFPCTFRLSPCPEPSPTPVPTPTPLPISKTFTERFKPKPDNAPGWLDDFEWEYPTAWTTVPGRDGDEQDRALLVKGLTPGFTNKAFDDFRVTFPISHVRGTKAGWFLRAQAKDGQISGYKFVLERLRDNSLFLHASAQGSTASKLSSTGCNVPIQRYKEQSNYYLEVTALAVGNEISYSFRLLSTDPDEPLPPNAVACEKTFKDESKSYMAGRIGFFAEDDTVFRLEDLFVKTP